MKCRKCGTDTTRRTHEGPKRGKTHVVRLVFLLRGVWLDVYAARRRAPCRCRHCRGLAGPDSDRCLPSPGRRG